MGFKKQEIIIPGTYPLSGILTLPSNDRERHPVVIMMHGSGDIDKDGNAKQLNINVFKELSDILVENGFATLRYDKRGVGQSEGDFYETGLFDLIDDAAAAVSFAKKHPEIDKEQIILLGHSEGSILAPAVGKRIAVQGMILIAGTAEPLANTTAWQREQMKRDIESKKGFGSWLLRLLNVSGKIDKINNELLQKIRSTEEAIVTYKGKKINAKWHREHEQYDVREYLKQVSCPVIAITGTKDVQVHPEHAREICELVQGTCESYLIEDMTHILRKTKAEAHMDTILKDYRRQAKEPVEQELKDKITAWLLRHFPA